MSSPFSISTRDVDVENVERRAIDLNPAATQRFWMSDRLANSGGSELTHPYRQHGMTYAASRAFASNIAQVPFLMHSGTSEEDEDIVRDGPWVELFDRPNPLIASRATFWETTILLALESCGMIVWVKESGTDNMVGSNEIPTELWPLSGKYFEPIIDDVTKLVAAWKYKRPDMSQAVVYMPEELVIFRLTDPHNALGGLGPYAPARLAYMQDFKAALYNEKFLDNDATPGGLLLAEGNLTPQQKDQIRESWEEKHQGIARRRRLAVLSGGLKYQETGSTHREMEFEKGRAFAWKEELAVIGVPEYEVGLTQNINMATAQMISKDWVSKKLIPFMRMMEDSMWSQLFNPIEGGQRSLMFSDSRIERRKRQASRMLYPNARKQLGRRAVSYYTMRTINTDARTGRFDFTPVRVRPEMSIWGEFDLTTIEALREDFNAKLEQAVKAQSIGVPFNQLNERLDLGFENLDGEAGETSFISGSLKPIDLAINPPEPTVVATLGDGSKPVPAKDEAGKGPATKPSAKEESKDDEKKAILRAKVAKFISRQSPKHAARWMEMIRKTRPLEDRFRSKYKRWLNEQREFMLNRLGNIKPQRADSELTKGAIEHILFDERAAKQRLLSLTHGVYVEASKVGIESAMTDMGGNFAFDVVDPKVVDAMDARKLKLSNSTTTLRNRVKRDIEQGVEAGETIHELQQRLRTDFNSFSGARSLMIARTEIAGATNTARNLAFSEEGVEKTQWITARDEAVRDSHADIDGDTAKVGEQFNNGLMYPGDPAGDAGEVINCRCVAIPVV